MADEPRRPDEAPAETAIGGSGAAPGLGAELGVKRPLAGDPDPAMAGDPDPAMAGAKPAMMGVYDRPERRVGGLLPLVLLLVVIAVLLALGWSLFATHSEAPKASALPPAEAATLAS